MYINKETAQEKLHKKYSLDPPRYPVSVQYPRTTGRMVSQLSTFTIHPRPCKDCAITEIMREEIYLIRYIIPKEKKKSFLRDLFLLGIRRHTLFQDLDSLSIDLVFKLDLLTEKVKVKIPKCGGLYKKND